MLYVTATELCQRRDLGKWWQHLSPSWRYVALLLTSKEAPPPLLFAPHVEEDEEEDQSFKLALGQPAMGMKC